MICKALQALQALPQAIRSSWRTNAQVPHNARAPSTKVPLTHAEPWHDYLLYECFNRGPCPTMAGTAQAPPHLQFLQAPGGPTRGSMPTTDIAMRRQCPVSVSSINTLQRRVGPGSWPRPHHRGAHSHAKGFFAEAFMARPSRTSASIASARARGDRGCCCCCCCGCCCCC